MDWFMFLWYQMVSQSQMISNLICFDLYFDAKHYHLYKFFSSLKTHKAKKVIKVWKNGSNLDPKHHLTTAKSIHLSQPT